MAAIIFVTKNIHFQVKIGNFLTFIIINYSVHTKNSSIEGFLIAKLQNFSVIPGRSNLSNNGKEYKIYSSFIVHGIYTFVRNLPFYNEREDKDELELDPEWSWRRRPQLLQSVLSCCTMWKQNIISFRRIT